MSPCTATEIAKGESLQRSFSKRLPGLNDFTHARRLYVLYMESLEIRPLRYDIIYVYKMLFGLVDFKFDEYFTSRANSAARGHEYNLLVIYSRLNIRKRFFK